MLHAPIVALCLVVVAVVRAPSPASAELMSNRYNEPAGQYRATSRRPPAGPPAGPWASGPYMPAPSVPGHSHPPYRPAQGPLPAPGGRNPPPGQPGHRHTPGYKGSWLTPVAQVDDNQIPLALFAQLNEVDDVAAFFRAIEGDDNEPEELESAVINRFGEEPVQRKSAVAYAKPAHCQPENQTVPLVAGDADPSAIYFPTCTRVLRCGGCCAGTIQSCQPTEMSTLSVRVAVIRYVNNKLKKGDSTLISVEQHTKCGCQCVVKESDCSQRQQYLPGECRCECTNRDDRDKCLTGGDRRWDNSTCACICIRQKNCSTGRYFNPRTCDCETLPERKRRTHPPVSDSQSEEADSQSEDSELWT